MSNTDTQEAVEILAKSLIGCPTVSPETHGIDRILDQWFASNGFSVHWIEVDGVKNLWAEIGPGDSTFCFAGHYDVVPTGDVSKWTTPPFSPVARDGYLFGRGAADMKGPVASFLIACERFLKKHSNRIQFRLAVLLAGDEEPERNHGTVDVLEWLKNQGRKIDHCIVTEPTSSEKTGDTVKVGRRGSFQGLIEIDGKQGHSAYPEWAENPITKAMPLIQAIDLIDWGNGTDDFPPSRLQFTNIHSGTGATNVVPGELTARFNLRFSPEWTPEKIAARVDQAISQFPDVRCRFRWTCDARPFLTPPGPFRELISSTIQRVCALTPKLTTGGGTSDARFISQYGTEVVELGPPGSTSHMIDERIKLQDLAEAVEVYQAILEQYNLTSQKNVKPSGHTCQTWLHLRQNLTEPSTLWPGFRL